MLDTVEVLDPKVVGPPASVIGIGVIETFRLHDGLDVILQRCRLSQDLIESFEGEDLLKFHVQLSGQRILKFQDRHEIELNGAHTAVLMHDMGVTKRERIVANGDERAVTMVVARNRLWEYLDEEQARLPPALHSLIAHNRCQPRLAVALPTPEEVAVTGAVFDSGRTGLLRRMYMEAKVMELFCLVMDRFHAEGNSSVQKSRVNQRDRRQLEGVRDFLSCAFMAPPTIHELARRFGLNRNKLCTGFLLLYGVTIYDFCSALRLDKARELLVDSGLTMTQIALTTGYGSGSAFSAAFHRRFGQTPSQCRRSGAVGHHLRSAGQ